MNSTVKPENDIAGTATQRPLLSRDFVLLVAGQGISLFGNVMLRFAMSMWVLDETGSATIFASVLAISIVPTILLSPFGGVLADRVNRRTIMVALDAISAVLVLASAIVFATTGFHIVAIATMQVLLAVLGAFETPTVQAALPQMFRQYGPATMRQGMAVINQVQQLSSLLPSFLGGVLYAMFGIRLMMIIAIASFAGAAALECFIRLSAPDRGDEELPTPLEDLKAGVRFLIKDRPNVFRLLLFAAALNFVLIGYSGADGKRIERTEQISGENPFEPIRDPDRCPGHRPCPDQTNDRRRQTDARIFQKTSGLLCRSCLLVSPEIVAK